MNKTHLQNTVWFSATTCILAVLLGVTGTAFADASMTMGRNIPGTGGYVPGETLQVEVVLETSAQLSALAVQETLPAGWTFAGNVNAQGAAMSPQIGDAGTISWIWIAMPAFPATLKYKVAVPAGTAGVQTMVGNAIYRTMTSGELSTEPAYTNISKSVLEMSRSASDYVAGDAVEVAVTLERREEIELTALALNETLPAGWTYAGAVNLHGASIQPQVGDGGTLTFIWVVMPEFPVQISYLAQAAADSTGAQLLSGNAVYRTNGSELTTATVDTEIQEVEPVVEAPVTHSADTDGDFAVSLPECLRLIQFFNSNGYGCAAGTEDGYAPGSTDFNCMPHDSDARNQDWDIELSELLRLL
ncbi:MAG: hypothetical protein IT368_12170, partial [Candidatus Hydrogenedentes bacterium]|nr:hypothetical protein [Candidatus Hydrogenedentota bacterium]